MAVLGFGDLRDTALPTLWDAGELAKVRLADGATFEGMVAEAQAALAELNRSLLTMPHYGGLFAVQNEPELEYPIGATAGFSEATEYSVPEPKRGATSGHMLPLHAYDRGLGWTIRYLKKARRTKLEADIRQVVTDGRDLWQKMLLKRLFTMEGETVGVTANASVPLADGGTVDTSYIPPNAPDGKTFLYTHDHFLRHTAVSTTNVGIAMALLWEHGYPPPYTLIVSQSDIATWTALTTYKPPSWPGLMGSAGVERVDMPDVSMYHGGLETDYGLCYIWATPRLPTGYWGVFKLFGGGDIRNPLRVRIDPAWGFGYNLVPGNWANAPMQMLVGYSEFGVGIGDRVNGVCTYVYASGDYVTPTIS